jgi:hypothetical protein
MGHFQQAERRHIKKILSLKKRTVNVYHVLLKSTRCGQKLTEKLLQLIRLLGYAGFIVRKFHN